jgi:CheY-like chemotaxis protein
VRTSASRATRLGEFTILVVEDEDRVREVVRTVFEMSGYHVLSARHGVEALALIGGGLGPVDLLVTDVVMPELGGRGLADRLARTYPELKVLYISGHSDEVLQEHGVLEPDLPLLRKPFTPTELLRRARALIAAIA